MPSQSKRHLQITHIGLLSLLFSSESAAFSSTQSSWLGCHSSISAAHFPGVLSSTKVVLLEGQKTRRTEAALSALQANNNAEDTWLRGVAGAESDSSSAPDGPRPQESHSGYQHLKLPARSRSLATSLSERNSLGLRGLLPAGVVPLTVQEARPSKKRAKHLRDHPHCSLSASANSQVQTAMEYLRALPNSMLKYTYLQTLQDGSEDVYFGCLTSHTRECMPIVYTPTVGQACLDWHRIFRHTPRGLYISAEDAGHLDEVLAAWPEERVEVIVVTDGERILGLGDLGANGMGIPIGKLALYAACGGIDPRVCLPVLLDVGTNNAGLRSDPAYFGLRRGRPEPGAPEYDALVADFISAAQRRFGRQVLIQFEDFGNGNAFRLLKQHAQRATCFNDDIQGTAAVALAGLLAAQDITQIPLAEHTILFWGAGEAGVGIADLVTAAVAADSGGCITVSQAREKIFMVDSKGLISSRRTGLARHKLNYAHDVEGCETLLECIKMLKPSVLIGVAAVPKAFTQEVVEAMAALHDAPVIFSLSNPTSKAECLATEAYAWSGGRAVFASGSPMEGATVGGRRLEPGQGNNAYIFPGVGLAAVAAGATSIDDAAFLVAARALAAQVPPALLAQGTLFPPLDDIREVSLNIAVAVARHFYSTVLRPAGVATLPEPEGDVTEHIRQMMYQPYAK